MNLKTFVINLDEYKANYNKQLPYLESLGLKVERFKGINAIKDEHLNPEYSPYISTYALNFTPKSIIGCSLSHILCCKYIYENFVEPIKNKKPTPSYKTSYEDTTPSYKTSYGDTTPSYKTSYGDTTPSYKTSYEDTTPFLIMEDDAYPLYSKEEFYKELNIALYEIEILDSGWDIIQLHSDAVYPTADTYSTHWLCGSTAAYLISYKGLEKMAKEKVFWHLDCGTQNFIKFNKYRVKNNLFWTDEKFSLNRLIKSNDFINNTHIIPFILNKINKINKNLLTIIPLRGEKSYLNILNFKIIKIPYLEKEYTSIDVLNYLVMFFILNKIINK